MGGQGSFCAVTMRPFKMPGDIHAIRSSNSLPLADEYVRLTNRQSLFIFSSSSVLVGAAIPLGPREKTIAGTVVFASVDVQALLLQILSCPPAVVNRLPVPAAFPGGAALQLPVGAVFSVKPLTLSVYALLTRY